MCGKAKSNHPYYLHKWVLFWHVDRRPSQFGRLGLLLGLPHIIFGIGYGFYK